MIISMPKCVSLLIDKSLVKKQNVKLNINVNNVDIPCVHRTIILSDRFDYCTLLWDSCTKYALSDLKKKEKGCEDDNG